MDKDQLEKIKKDLDDALATAKEELAFLEEAEQHREKTEELVNELDEDFDSNEKDLIGDKHLSMWTHRYQNVKKALKKIESGKYGNCENCKKPIQEARLKAIPYAQYCIECEEKLEEKSN